MRRECCRGRKEQPGTRHAKLLKRLEHGQFGSTQETFKSTIERNEMKAERPHGSGYPRVSDVICGKIVITGQLSKRRPLAAQFRNVYSGNRQKRVYEIYRGPDGHGLQENLAICGDAQKSRDHHGQKLNAAPGFAFDYRPVQPSKCRLVLRVIGA